MIEKTTVRRSVINLALTALATHTPRLDAEGKLVQRVYVPHHRAPGSFPRDVTSGGLFLRFVRGTTLDQWQFDSTDYVIKEDL